MLTVGRRLRCGGKQAQRQWWQRRRFFVPSVVITSAESGLAAGPRGAPFNWKRPIITHQRPIGRWRRRRRRRRRNATCTNRCRGPRAPL